ncbi:MAG: hypothetical protein J6A28_02960 [Clostridia bacterium]|nr:hypothetical protein [Clostridia bacterium]
MKFSEKQINELKKAWKEGKKITIKGINNFGAPFTTTGVITSTDKKQPAVYEDRIYLEFGKERKTGRQQTEWFSSYCTEYRDEEYLTHFVIFSLEVEGKVLYDNPDKKETTQKAEKRGAEYIAKAKSEGRDKLVDCKVVDFLKTKIGQPIRIINTRTVEENGKRVKQELYHDAIMLGIYSCTKSGAPIIELSDGPGISNDFVERNTMVQSVGDDMAAEKKISNDKESYDLKLEEILEEIITLKMEDDIEL